MSEETAPTGEKQQMNEAIVGCDSCIKNFPRSQLKNINGRMVCKNCRGNIRVVSALPSAEVSLEEELQGAISQIESQIAQRKELGYEVAQPGFALELFKKCLAALKHQHEPVKSDLVKGLEQWADYIDHVVMSDGEIRWGKIEFETTTNFLLDAAEALQHQDCVVISRECAKTCLEGLETLHYGPRVVADPKNSVVWKRMQELKQSLERKNG